MKLVKNFKSIQRNYTLIAGGKGASLGELVKAKIPVPPGFVILTDAFDFFIKDNKLEEFINREFSKIKNKNSNNIKSVSRVIRKEIIKGSISKRLVEEIESNYKKLDTKFVAVRSSATTEDSVSAAWAGQLDTFLNTTKKDLFINIKECWASLFTERAIFYRFENNLNKEKISVAVVIQKMIQSEKSGIAFSVHPVTENLNHIIIEAGFGLGEAIVSGSITPDNYIVNKKNNEIEEININKKKKKLVKNIKGGNRWININKEGKKQVLDSIEIIELSKIIKKIEKHYRYPSDIEWAKEKGKFYILQNRPITTLKNKIKAFKEDYVKIFNRSLYVMSCENYDIGERVELFKASGGRYYMDPLFYKLPNKGTDVYYNFTDPKQEPTPLINFFNNNEIFLLKLKDKFYKDCDILREAISNKKFINFKKLFDYTVRIWPLVAISNMFGDNRDEIRGVKKHLVLLFREMRRYSDGLTHNSHVKLSFLLKDQVPEKYKKYIKYLRYKEIVNKKYPSLKILKERKAGFIFHKGKLYTGISLKEYGKKNKYTFTPFKKNIKDSDKIKGQVAYRGKVRGKVKVIFEVEDVKKIKKGDILVTSMTTPDFIVAMKKASAFITDEGGVTCHASIVAREIKKPCIIGTKVATEILNDGDLVEVNANKGVINILKRK